MSLRAMAIAVGVFSVLVGWLSYDPEVATAPVPIISGVLVIALAIFGLIPEFVHCPKCGKKSLGKKPSCTHCGASYGTDGGPVE